MLYFVKVRYFDRPTPALFNLHRPYFSLAVKEAPNDPLRHKYGPSVMAIYRSTWRILTNVQSAYRVAPGVIGRHNLLWSHSLACAVCLFSASYIVLVLKVSADPLMLTHHARIEIETSGALSHGARPNLLALRRGNRVG